MLLNEPLGRVNSALKNLKLCSAFRAKIDEALSIRFFEVIIGFLVKTTPYFNHPDDLTQSFFTFRTFQSRHTSSSPSLQPSQTYYFTPLQCFSQSSLCVVRISLFSLMVKMVRPPCAKRRRSVWRWLMEHAKIGFGSTNCDEELLEICFRPPVHDRGSSTLSIRRTQGLPSG